MSEKDVFLNETQQDAVPESAQEVVQVETVVEEKSAEAAYTYTPYELAPAPTPKKKKLGKKKIIAIVAAAVVLLLVIAFSGGKSDAAKAVDEQIKAIGKVSLESGAMIEEAEKAVNNLSEDDRDDLDKLNKLEKAREKYDKLVLEDNVNKIEEAIDAIGEVSVEAGDKIEAARAAYDEASDEVKAEIGNLDKLENAEKEYNNLLVDETIGLINQIGTVTLESKDKIAAAREAYDTLTDENKKAVTNAETLENAEAELKKLEEAEKKKQEEAKKKKIKEALAECKSDKDDVYGTVWYYPSVFPNYIDTRSYFLPFIAKTSGGSYYMYIRANYTGDDWIFWDTLVMSIDGEIEYEFFDYSDIHRDNGGGDVWEYGSIIVNDSNIETMKKIANSKKTIIRFDGDDDQYDLTISEKDKKALKQFIKIYELINS